MTRVEIEVIGPQDRRFAEWHAVIADAYAVEREAGWWESLAATRIYFARAEGRSRHVALVATVEGKVVGGAELRLPLDADLETLSVELGVAPDHRRAGVGAALLAAVTEVASTEARTIAQAELFIPDGVADDMWPGARFAMRHGLRCVSVEHRFLLDLPVPDERLAEDDAGVVSWVGPCPERYLEQWAWMRTRMNHDVPTGELTVTAREVDAQRIRDSDRAMAEQGWTKVRSMAVDGDGAGLGYTELLVSEHDPDIVVQDDTWVDRAHRGRRLGLRLKVANLRLLHEHDAGALLGRRRGVQTYCEQDNVAMRRINERLGFRLVDTLCEYEGPMGRSDRTR
jgi:mycothiol synthase